MGLLTFGLGNAQVLISDNYDALTVGNISTDITGATVGQGDYYAQGAAATDFQIVSEGGTQANVVQITGSALATGNKFLFKQITNWASRTAGNNVIDVEFDMFTGGATTSKNTARVYIYNSDGSTALAGLMFNFETKAISGIAYYDPNNGGANPVSTYSFAVGASNAVVTLTPNSWVRLGMSYNTVTREVIWKGPGFYSGTDGAVPPTGTTSPGEIDYIHVAGGTANAVSVISKFDNLSAKAVATEALLGSSDFNYNQATIMSVYPNPFVDYVSINLVDTQINSVKVMDINGRIVKTANNSELSNAKVNLSELTNGVYLMTIETENGVSTQKIIKN